MTGHLNVGFELEMSDIKTADAATIVYGDLVHWKDRYGDHARPTLTYDRFHVMSDGTLRNSDGTRCMNSYRDSQGRWQRADWAEGHPDHLKWKGAELISPVRAMSYSKASRSWKSSSLIHSRSRRRPTRVGTSTACSCNRLSAARAAVGVTW
jgi:hypothetical protein